MKTLLFVAVALALSACVQRVNVLTLADSADTRCRLANTVFANYERCVRASVAADERLNTGPNVDLVNRYLAGLRILSERVANGEIDDGSAFWASAEYYSGLKDTFINRAAVSARMDAQAEAARQRRAEFLGAMGLSLMQMGAPHTLGPAPRAPLNCVQQGAFVTCY